MREPNFRFICGLLGFVLIIGWVSANDATDGYFSSDEIAVAALVNGLDLVGRLPRKPGGIVGYMTVHGKHVYLAGQAGFQVVDVSNPAAPTVVGSYQPKEHVGPIAASGDHAYVVEKDDVLRVLDVSNPAQPRVVASSKVADSVRGLAVAGNYVYVSMSDTLQILDVSDPANPRESGACRNLELAGRVTVDGKYAYVAADFNGMRIIDVSNPAKPREIGFFEGPGNVTKIAVADHFAYLADYTGGLYIVDISNPKKPKQIGRYGDFIVGDVALAGTFALVAGGVLEVIDVSRPDHPRKVGDFSQKEDDTAWSVAVAGDFVYTISDAGLFIFRVRKTSAGR
jgi:hypothetical protein